MGYSPCKTLLSERIPPFPQEVRDFLVDRFCFCAREDLAGEIKASDANRDCLIRPYLGRRRFFFFGNDNNATTAATADAAASASGSSNSGVSTSNATKDQTRRPSRKPQVFFSLRNYPLHLDQMEELGLGDGDIKGYARTMAEALAMMHWVAEVDANDVEFVLAPPRAGEEKRPRWRNVLGEHVMWLLDFDCCRPMAMDEEGVEQAVAAFSRNDPFYPRPGQALWAIFKETYLRISSRIMADEKDQQRTRLPYMFIEKAEAQKTRTGL